MNNVFLKDVLRDIKKSKGRFFSIFVIIALGVAFFAGIKVSPITMKKTSDKYYDDYNFMDLTLYSTLGFTDSDITEIKKLENIEDVFPTYSVDTVTKIGASELVIKVTGIPLNSDQYVNKCKLIEGRFPEKENECIIEAEKIKSLGLNIGDKIKLESGTNNEINSTLEISEYEIVGTVQTPYYLSHEKGTSNIGNGKIFSYIAIPINNFKIPSYTEVYVTVKNAKALNTYSKKYSSLIENVKASLESLGNERSTLRYDEILKKKLGEEISLENNINYIEKPNWYVIDRNSHYSYVDYKNNADSIDELAKVFPVFFFLVAALVCLTTMTRMVDEQRINIGTLKGLGYSKYKIVSKYIIYSFTSSFLGSFFGLLIGYTVFPIVIFDAYGIMYSLPKLELDFNIPLGIFITLISVSVTTLSSVLACYKELLETPATLMRPKAPKEGKRILIERVNFIWNRLSFIGKVTIRNIFRYKKRFFMTVFGIAGCTALLITGFGIKDSIKTIVDKQFGYIFKYDLTVNIKKDASILEKKELQDELSNLSEIDKLLMISSENGKIEIEGLEKNINIITPEDISKIEEFVNFTNRISKEDYKLNDSGIILSEKIAKQSKVKVGDEVKIKINNKEYSCKISGITENYTFNYLYISPNYYKEVFGKDPIYNSIIVNTKNIKNEDEFSLKLIDNKIVNGVSFNTSIRENFDNMIKSLNYVIIVIIISAGTLAFVVLYNLTNVNISERIREIATIKVLGFYDKEVSAYIYRENIFLTIFGILLGEFLGILLHRFIMVTVEIDNMMFGRNIDFSSFILSAILTIVFAILVNSVMFYKLKKVKMVESLKSVD